jgi:hypothetical protein
VREGDRQWHATRRHGRMGDDNLGVLRKEEDPRWAGAGSQWLGGLESSGELKQIDGP